jgi:hypothetical protein
MPCTTTSSMAATSMTTAATTRERQTGAQRQSQDRNKRRLCEKQLR